MLHFWELQQQTAEVEIQIEGTAFCGRVTRGLGKIIK